MSVTLGLALATLILAPVIYVIYMFLLFYADVRRRAKYIHKFPGVPPHPLWGNVHEFPGPGESGLAFMRQRASQFPRVIKVWYGHLNPTVNIVHPEPAKEILKTSEPKPLTIGAYRFLYNWLGEGLLIAGGAKWSRNRRLLTPAFHFDILKPYMEVNNSCVKVFMDKVNDYSARGEAFEVFEHISLLTLDIILRCAFSYDNDCQIRGENHPYVKAVNELQVAAVDRLLKPWLYPNFIYNMTKTGQKFNKNCNFVHSVSRDIIQRRRKTLENVEQKDVLRSGRYLDFLDILLFAKDDAGMGLTDGEIRDEVDTFLFEGHDTTASGISWTLFSLATHPEWQHRCQQEVDALLEGRESNDILWEDLSELRTLSLCIKEALRLHTPVPFIERQTTKDMTLDGRFLPKGTVVDIQLYCVHHNEQVWEDPMEYRPERFLQENLQKKDNFAFLPFSAGPRNCIGQNFAMHEMKVVIASILRRFNLELKADKTVEHRITVVMKTEQGMYMNAIPRTCRGDGQL